MNKAVLQTSKDEMCASLKLALSHQVVGPGTTVVTDYQFGTTN